MSYSLDFIIKLNDTQKNRYKDRYIDIHTKDQFECMAKWRIETNDDDGAVFLIRDSEAQGLKYINLNTLMDVFMFYKHNPMWYISNISKLRQFPNIVNKYIITKQDWMKVLFEIYHLKLKTFSIIQIKDLTNYISRVTISGKYKIINISSTPFIKLLCSKDNREVLLVSDLKLVITKDTTFCFDRLNVEHVKIDNLEIDSSVTDLSFCFAKCTNTKSIELHNFDTSNVENFSGMFSSCVNLEKLNIEDLDVTNAKYVMGMFSNCKSLKSLNLKGFNMKKVKTYDGMLEGLENISIELNSSFDKKIPSLYKHVDIFNMIL